jgi:hypothetical protein
VVRADVTSKIVRLGGMSKDELVSKFNMSELERLSDHVDP